MAKCGRGAAGILGAQTRAGNEKKRVFGRCGIAFSIGDALRERCGLAQSPRCLRQTQFRIANRVSPASRAARFRRLHRARATRQIGKRILRVFGCCQLGKRVKTVL